MAQVMFEEVAVYFSPSEWAELTGWQKDLYRAVMVENYEAVASLGAPSTKPELICRIQHDEDPSMEDPLASPRRKRPHSPWLGDGIRMEVEAESKALGSGWQRKRTKKVPLSLVTEKPLTQVPKSEKDALPRATLKANPPQCPECAKTFLSNVAMTIHIRTHTGERPFKCHLCPKGFPSNGDLKRHIKTHLRKKDAPAGRPGSGPKTRKCLTAKLQLLRQLGVAPPGQRKPHTCAQCGKSFSKKQDLRKHQGTHSSERPFACPQCGRSFRLKQILVAHTKVHVGERPFACGECGKRFSQKHHVESHRRVHTGEKPFCCTTCGKRYSQKQPLISHLRVHTGERPYACVECGKTFRNQATLTIHYRMHTGERPYRCLLCGKACSQLQHLKSHQRVHRGEQHLLRSGDTEALALKRASEVREKPYQCGQCEKRFRDEKVMQIHLKTHEEAAVAAAALSGGPLGSPEGSRPSLPLSAPSKKPSLGQRTAGRRGRTSKKPPAAPPVRPQGPAGKRAFACTDCGRRFTQAKYLTMHRRSHT